MAEIFKMPKLGMDMEEGTIVKWRKAEGEIISKGEIFAEIETDKSTVEVEAPVSGTVLKLYYPEGTTKDCGVPIAVIGQPGEVIPTVGEETAAPAQATAPASDSPAAESQSDLFFLMPKLGMDMEEGTIVKWLKAEGDPVRKGEPFAEIETDKSTVEVEALTSGVVLKLYYPEGTTLACNKPIAAIGAPGQQAPELSAAPPEPAPAPQAQAVPQAAPRQTVPTAPPAVSQHTGKLRATPRARRLAQKNGVDLYLVPGSGPNGRIVEQDVRNFMENGGKQISAAPVRVPQETVVPLAGVRKITANRMRQSLSEMAQTNTRMDVDMTNMTSLRKQMNARLEQDGIKISFLDLLVAACAKALIENPQANASLQADGIHYKNYANIGIAVDSEKGLVVPVIKNADVLSLVDISKNSRAMIEKARKGALAPDDMKGGTFTISNLGMFEVDSFTAIVNPPETCILAVGRIADRAVVENGQVVVRPMMNLCLSYDHRVIDGAPSARFLQRIKHYIENPVWLLM